jgi:hypothetical protein
MQEMDACSQRLSPTGTKLTPWGVAATGEKVGFRNQKLGKNVHRQIKRRGEPARRPVKPRPPHAPAKA